MQKLPKLSDADLDLLIQALKLDAENARLFLQSEQCKSMCNDIVTHNTCINNEYFAYYPDRLKEELGWVDKSYEDIKLFFQAMSRTDGLKIEVDDDCPFDNVMFTRHGVLINVLSGQGTLVTIQSPNYKKEST